MDNFSRKTLGIRVALKKSAKLACENLKEVYEKNNLKNRENIMIMINDSGSENISVTKKYIESLSNMTQYFANGQKKNQWTNNMIEAHFKKIKKFIREHEYKDMNSFMTKLEETIELCNATIPIAATGGRTPNEAFEGINPFPENFSEQLEKAKRRRIMVNETGECF
jgi:6-phosphogluconolactonase/glucosamine-6-phosphate isomerase/deaminase